MSDQPLTRDELIEAITEKLQGLQLEQLQLLRGYVESGLKWQSENPELERRRLELDRARREIADLKADQDDTYRQLDEALNSGDGTYKP